MSYLPSRFTNISFFPEKKHVFTATDQESQREVVVKTSTKRDSTLSLEADLLQQMRGQGVVDFIDFIAFNGKWYLVTERLKAPTLASYVRKQKLMGSRARKLCISLCTPMAFLNSIDYLYRDFYDHHVFCVSSDKVKWIDFGNVLGPVGKRGFVRNPHTLGFWRTMAPEEFEVGQSIGPTANVYSLACMCCYVCTRKYPLDAIATSPGAVRSLVESKQDPSEKKYVLSQVSDKKLARVLERALSWTTDDRYHTVTDLIDDLKRIGTK